MIHGTIENSIIGRGCVNKKGAVIRNSIVLGGCMIGENVHIENQVVDNRSKSPADGRSSLRKAILDILSGEICSDPGICRSNVPLT